MKASTVFALALALLVGLAAAAGAKYAGLFNKKEATAAPAVVPPPQYVLVPRVNLFEEYTVTADQVNVRPVRPEEVDYLQSKFGPAWKEKLMPALPAAAHQRVARTNLMVDQLLFKEHFHDQSLPDSLSVRLEPNTRAVNVAVPKERAGGGALRLGEHVDVFLTTRVSNGEREALRTACIARACKVIMKRNNLWALMGSDPEGPLPFTLQANLYRAALIEHAQTVGTISLMPVPTPPKYNGSWSDPASKEYATEDRRIEEIQRGDRTIGDDDLVRIFNVLPASAKPATPPPFRTEHLVGVQTSGVTVFPSKPQTAASNPVVPAGGVPAAGSPGAGGNGAGDAGTAGTAGEISGVRFGLPSATGEQPGGCKTCGKPAAPVDPYKTIGGNK